MLFESKFEAFFFSFSGKIKGRGIIYNPDTFFLLAQLICYKITLGDYKPKGNVLNALLSWIITGVAILYHCGKSEILNLWVYAPPIS